MHKLGAFMKNNQLDDNSIESKNVAELSSFNLLLQKDNSPNTLSSKSPKSLFDKKKEISFEKSAFLEANEDKIMQESAIYSIKKQKKPNENEVLFIYFINFLHKIRKTKKNQIF